jgi:hypothetical protein
MAKLLWPWKWMGMSATDVYSEISKVWFLVFGFLVVFFVLIWAVVIRKVDPSRS